MDLFENVEGILVFKEFDVVGGKMLMTIRTDQVFVDIKDSFKNSSHFQIRFSSQGSHSLPT